MTEAVTDIILARSREPRGINAMVAWSLAAHVVVIAAIVVAPRNDIDEAPREIMTISLGGAEGPKTGGLTQAGGRSVPPPAPSPPVTRPEPTPAPPASKPAMTLPDPNARTQPRTPPQRTGAETPRRSAAQSAEPAREGSTPAETVVRGQGFGLSSAGGGAGGPAFVDAPNFCCPEYLQQMVSMIQRVWNQNQGRVGTTQMKFTITRDGTIQAPEVEISSGFLVLDEAARRALALTRLPPLPAAFPNPTLTVHMRFEYHR